MPTDHDNVLARYNAIWTQIAATFRDSPRDPALREHQRAAVQRQPRDAQRQPAATTSSTPSFHTIVRASGGNNATRLLVLPTLHTNADQDRMDALVSHDQGAQRPQPRRHRALLRLLAVQREHRGRHPLRRHRAERPDRRLRPACTTPSSPRASPSSSASTACSASTSNHPSRVEQGEKLKFFEHLGYYARAAGVTTMLWDNGLRLPEPRPPSSGRDPELFGQIKSSWTTRSGTASSTRSSWRSRSAITAKTLTLNLNGTTFRGLWQGSTKLVRGTGLHRLRQTSSPSRPRALTRLAGNRAYGVNATLQARFSRGLPWQIDVITYDPPVLVQRHRQHRRVSPSRPSSAATSWPPWRPRTPTAATPARTTGPSYKEFDGDLLAGLPERRHHPARPSSSTHCATAHG